MRFMKVLSLLSFLVVFAQTSFSASYGITSKVRCEAVFKVDYARKTVSQLKADAYREQQLPNKGRPPQHATPKNEFALAKTWTGETGPLTLQSLLPQGASFIDHAQPRANEDGLVKSGSSFLTHIRVQLGNVGTNMGVPTMGLMANANRSNKSVIRDEAEAVIVFVHGGGTKTTGHHVAAGMMSYMSHHLIDVVSMDMPWHGEGPRVSFDSVKDSMEQMREFVKAYVAPSGKKIILVGHSMGGLIADMYMRMYPKDDLFSAVVPLSNVADAAPGKALEEKYRIDEQTSLYNLTNPKIPESERNLSESLAKQNKISPTCGMYCQMLHFGLEWQMPKHKGDEYLPALYIMGEGDALYQGYQTQFTENVANLNNSEFKIIGKRRNIKDKDENGELITIGHLIFDHKPWIDVDPSVPAEIRKKIFNGNVLDVDPTMSADTKKKVLQSNISTEEFERLRKDGLIHLDPEIKGSDLKDPETFVWVRNFVSKVVGKDLSVKRKQPSGLSLAQVLNAYANNLAFRQFANNYVFQNIRSTEKTKALGEKFSIINKELGDLNKTKKANKGLTPEQEARYTMLANEQAQIKAILSGEMNIPGPQGERLKQLNVEAKSIREEVNNLLSEERNRLRSEVEKLKPNVIRAEKNILELAKRSESKRIQQLQQQADRVFVQLMSQDAVVRSLTGNYLLENFNQKTGKFTPQIFENLPENAERAFESYERLSMVYQKTLNRLKAQILAEAIANSLRIHNPDLNQQLQQSVEIYRSGKSDLHKRIARIELIDMEMAKNSTRLFEIESEKHEILGDEYFSMQEVTLATLLSHDLGYFMKNIDEFANPLQRIWADWQKLWLERVVDVTEVDEIN